MKTQLKSGRGGKRKGAGAPKKVQGEPVKIAIYCDADLIEQLDIVAKSRNQSRSTLIREILESTDLTKL